MSHKLFFILILIVVVFTSCGKTDEDKDMEERIIGKWWTTGLDFSYVYDTVFFTFDHENTGSTEVGTEKDIFNWEIVRNTLKTYYSEAPNYAVGFDKYNSQGMYSIKKFDDDEIELEQHLYNGVYTIFKIHRVK
ncbi:MAG: hypothetical protein Kow0068_04970 [Marinilabiliales bacterium]